MPLCSTKLGPGPGAYMLPTTIGYEKHDQTKYRNPQYSMGPKFGQKYCSIGPGPGYDVGRFTKYGKISPPMYSMSYRPKDLTTFRPPGPGTYSPELAPRMKEPRPPAYSMSFRHAVCQGLSSPAPNQYPQPSTIGPKIPHMPASSAYTMSGKHCHLEMEKSPGPARYGETKTNLYKNKPPTYTMGIKHCDLGGRSPNPGPAGYLPKLQGPCCKPAGYSFGRRTCIEPFITAADNMPCVRRTNNKNIVRPSNNNNNAKCPAFMDNSIKCCDTNKCCANNNSNKCCDNNNSNKCC